MISASKTFKFAKKAAGTVTYKRIAKGSSKWLSVSKNGVITVKKRAPKKMHAIRVKVSAGGNMNYKKAAKTVTVKVRVK